MFSPYAGFTERDMAGFFVTASVMNSGIAVDLSASDTSTLTPSPYANSMGTIAAATTTTGLRELGWLLQPVTASGPSLFSVLSSIYDESAAEGATAVVVLSRSGALITTDQYLASGTGKIAFDGTVTPNTYCSIASGKPRVTQSGDQSRLKFLGQVTQRGFACASFQII